MKIASAKNKGREGEKKVISMLIERFPHLSNHLHRKAGPGEDIVNSQTALEQLPFDHEIKRRKRLGFVRWFEQIYKRIKPGLEPVVWAREDFDKQWYVIIRAEFFLEMVELWSQKRC